MMLSQKPDANAEIGGGRCPLHYAADMGQTQVAQFLVEKGADVNVCCSPPAKIDAESS